ncbi:MAG: RDD family protein [Pseudomonadota bacterium]|jgi:uncharacterized RDD family membrane protein YckC|nr:RDD family protein [Pseudomonadota bacterium]
MVSGPGYNPTYRPPHGLVDPRATEGVLGRRLIGYVVDLVVITILMGLLWLVIAVLGVITFGFGWLLFGLLPLTAIVYNALTVGGPSQGTIGMRMAGVRVVDGITGGRVSILQAAVHALLFYVAVSTAVLLAVDVLIGFGRSDRRLGHDLLSGVTLVRAS